MSEIPVHSRPRRLAEWLNPTGAKKVHSLIDKVYQRKNLERAWERVRANRGSGGVDGQSLEAYGAQLDQQLDRLQQKLREQTYQPQPVRQAPIPKAGGKPGEVRMLGVPTVSFHTLRMASFVERPRRYPKLTSSNTGSKIGSSRLSSACCSGSNTGPKQTASWRNSGNGWQSSDWSYTQARRAGSSSGDSPSKTGNEEERKSLKTFDFLRFTHICAKNRNGNYVINDSAVAAGSKPSRPKKLPELGANEPTYGSTAPVAVGISVTRYPRTDPHERFYRMRLLSKSCGRFWPVFRFPKACR